MLRDREIIPDLGDVVRMVAGEIGAASRGEWGGNLSETEKRLRMTMRMLDSGDAPIQWAALRELGEQGGEEALDLIEPFLDSPNPNLRATAEEAMERVLQRVGPSTPPPPPPRREAQRQSVEVLHTRTTAPPPPPAPVKREEFKLENAPIYTRQTMAEAATTVPPIPPMAEMEKAAPEMPKMAELPPLVQ